MSGASGSVRLISPLWPVWRTEPCAGTGKVQPARKADGMLGDGIRFFSSPHQCAVHSGEDKRGGGGVSDRPPLPRCQIDEASSSRVPGRK